MKTFTRFINEADIGRYCLGAHVRCDHASYVVMACEILPHTRTTVTEGSMALCRWPATLVQIRVTGMTLVTGEN